MVCMIHIFFRLTRRERGEEEGEKKKQQKGRKSRKAHENYLYGFDEDRCRNPAAIDSEDVA